MQSLDAILVEAQTALSNNQFEQAERLAQRVLTQSPQFPPAWHILAQARSAQGRVEEGLAAWRHLASLLPASLDAQIALAETLFDSGRSAEASRHLAGWSANPGVDGEGLARVGLLLAQRGCVDDAVAVMTRALESLPMDARLRNNLGVALSQAGRQEEAVVVLQQSAELDPGYTEPWYNLGNVLTELKRKDESAQAYRQALSVRPDHTGALNNLGLLLQSLGQPGESVILLRQLCRISPQSAEARKQSGTGSGGVGPIRASGESLPGSTGLEAQLCRCARESWLCLQGTQPYRGSPRLL